MKTGFDLKKSRKLMEKEGIDCIIANSQESVYYTSNAPISTITNLKRFAGIILPLDAEPLFAVHRNEEVTARKSTWIKDLRVYEGGEWESLKAINFLAEVIKERGLEGKKIGLELMEVPGLWLDHLRNLLPTTEFVDAKPILDILKSIKTPEEIKHLSNANMVTAKAITVAFEMARPGDTERDVALNMIDLTLEYGGDTVAFMCFGAGPNIHETHPVPGEYKLKEGDLVHTDFGCFFEGYYSDISRMAVVGKPNKTQLKAYSIAVEAEQKTAEALESGIKVIDVHNAVKAFYNSKGYEYNRAFIGHAIGIGVHEWPFLGPAHADWVIKPGMFFQVEPSMIIGDAKIHTEDAFVVKTKGPAENVSLYRDLTELQIIK
jgi:Xaa-Pro aminopeptidase